MSEKMTDEELGRAILGYALPREAGQYFSNVGAAARRLVHEDDLRPIGWIYFNEDAGTEFSPDHPVESGECEDAKDIREASAENLLAEMLAAWEDRREEAREREETIARLIAERDAAFQAGAEADRALIAEWCRRVSALTMDGADVKDAIGALPLPTHDAKPTMTDYLVQQTIDIMRGTHGQSSTQTGTNPTTGHRP